MPAKHKFAAPGTVGDALYRARTHLGMTQREFAKQIAVDWSQYARYERGERTPPLERIQDISARLNVDLLASVTPKRTNGPSEEGPSMEARRALLEAAKQVRALSDALYDQATAFTPMTVPAAARDVRDAVKKAPKKAAHR